MTPRPAVKRPRFVTILALVVFFLSSLHLASATVGIIRRTVYWPLLSGSVYWLVVGLMLLWGGAFVVLSWGLWMLKPWARRAALVCFAGYAATQLISQLLLVEAVYERGRLPFVLVITVLFLTVAVFGLTRQRVKRAFERSYEESDT